MLRSTIFSGASSKIMFEDLPYVDRVLQLCLDIYLVRESLEFTLEEDLFAKLIFLYRSPETMIKWTRPKKERNEDDTDSLSTDTKVSIRKKTGNKLNIFGSVCILRNVKGRREEFKFYYASYRNFCFF